VDWICLAKDRNRWRALVNSELNLRVSWNAGKLSNGLTPSGLSSSVQLHIVSWWDLIFSERSLPTPLFSNEYGGRETVGSPELYRY
jgi:hypothetical protein